MTTTCMSRLWKHDYVMSILVVEWKKKRRKIFSYLISLCDWWRHFSLSSSHIAIVGAKQSINVMEKKRSLLFFSIGLKIFLFMFCYRKWNSSNKFIFSLVEIKKISIHTFMFIDFCIFFSSSNFSLCCHVNATLTQKEK